MEDPVDAEERTDVPIQVALERAELAARERRLTAAAEAERIMEEARSMARAIDAAVDGRATSALAERREALMAAASAEAAAIEAEIDALGPTFPVTADPERRAAIERAAERLVTAVLGETTAAGGS
jgi:hypothetical protein